MTIKLPALLVLLAAAVTIGIVAGLSIDGDNPVPVENRPAVPAAPAPRPQEIAVPDGGVTAARVEALERQLEEGVNAREALERRLAELERRLAALAGAGGAANLDAEIKAPDSPLAPEHRAWFDENTLLESGMDRSLANELKAFFEQLELERLYLRDRSAREGWERDRLRDEMRLLDDREQELKERLGESAYDAYLYASGQPNRVAVTSVLDSAQAAQAGIRPGDLIIRYDRERVYNWRDLRAATRSGSLADTVEVEVERDGDTLQLYLVRGPLGIRMDSRSVAP